MENKRGTEMTEGISVVCSKEINFSTSWGAWSAFSPNDKDEKKVQETTQAPQALVSADWLAHGAAP